MDVQFEDSSLKETFVSLENLTSKYGKIEAKKLRRLADELRASSDFACFDALPHINCSVSNPNKERVILKEATIQVVLKLISSHPTTDSSDWSQITTIKIVKVRTETHD